MSEPQKIPNRDAPKERAIIAVGLLIICMFVAQRVGLVALIANR